MEIDCDMGAKQEKLLDYVVNKTILSRGQIILSIKFEILSDYLLLKTVCP